MTDTVNVPRDAVDRVEAIAEGASIADVYGAEWCLDAGASFRTDLRNVFAAAPKAEPVDMPALDRLFYGGKAYLGAEEAVRQIVGLQAELAALRAQREAPKAEPVKTDPQISFENMRRHFPSDLREWTDLTDDQRKEWEEGVSERPHLYNLSRPEAPKVEQEPWDHAVRYRDYGWGYASELPADQRELVLQGIPFWEVKPLYTHPAPASDELLEALEFYASEWQQEANGDQRIDGDANGWTDPEPTDSLLGDLSLIHI